MSTAQMASPWKRSLAAFCAALVAVSTFLIPTQPASAEPERPIGGPVLLDGNTTSSVNYFIPYLSEVYQAFDELVTYPGNNGRIANIGLCSAYPQQEAIGPVDTFSTGPAIAELFDNIETNPYKVIHICLMQQEQYEAVQASLDAIAYHVNRGGGLYFYRPYFSWVPDLFGVQANVMSGWPVSVSATASASSFHPEWAEGDTHPYPQAEAIFVGTNPALDVYFTTSSGDPVTLGSPKFVFADTPGKPTITSISSSEPGEVTLKWTAPEDDGGADITDYVIEFSLDGVDWEVFDDGVSTATTAVVDGLTRGPHMFRVSAVTAAGTGEPSDTVTETVVNVPAAPVVTVTNVGEGFIEISWEHPDDGGKPIVAYNYEIRRAGTQYWQTDLAWPEPITSLRIDDLGSGKSTWEIRLQAWNGYGPGEWSDVVTVSLPGTPGAVRNLDAIPGDRQVTLRWDEPADHGFSEITEYKVQGIGGTDVCTPQGVEDEPGTYECKVTGLVNGDSYTFGVYAVNGQGNGPSTYVNNVTPYGKPLGPDNVEVLIVGDGYAEIMWEEAEENGSPITSYEILLDGEVVDTVGSPGYYRFEDLENGHTYTVGVRAVNAAGAGTPATDTFTPYGAPDAPVVTVTEGDGEITLSWEPVDGNGRPLTGYVILINSNDFYPLGPDVTSYTVTGLENGVIYTFEVWADSTAFSGDVAYVQGSPYGPASAPGDLTIVDGDGVSAISWSASDGNGRDVTGYQILVDGEVEATVPAGTLAYTLEDLTNGVTYDIEVRAVTEGGPGEAATGQARPFTVPDAPVLNIVEGDQELTISWEPVAGNGRAVESYDVHVYGRLVASLPGNTTSYTIDQSWDGEAVQNGVYYQIAVRAANEAGYSPFGLTSGVPYGVPTSPTDVDVTEGDTELVVTWGEVENSNGRPVTAYRVYLDGELFEEVDADTFEVTIDDLTNGEAYTVEVAAVNLRGEGDRSTVSDVVPYGVPGAPEVTVTEADRALEVTWTEPDTNGRPVTAYTVYVDGEEEATVSGSATSYTIEGLTNGDTYDVAVTATNLRGEGPAGEAGGSPYGAAFAPEVEAVAADQAALISWSAPDGNGRDLAGYKVWVNGEEFATVTADDTELVLDELDNGTTYVVKVAALTAYGEGERGSATVVPFGKAFAPNVHILEGDHRLNVSWTNADGNGRPVLAYEVYVDGEQYATVEPEVTFLTVEGLTNGTDYVVDVVARTIAGAGEAGTATGNPYGKATAPEVNLTGLGNENISVSWTTADGNGRPVEGYRISAGGKTVAEVGPKVRSYRIDGLENGRTYKVEVAAVTAAGPGAAGSVEATPFTSPDVPNVTIGETTNGTLTINWANTGDGGAPIVSVEIRITGNGVDRVVTVDQETGTYDFDGLEPGTYEVTVMIVNAGGEMTQATFSYTIEPRKSDFVDVEGSVFEEDIAWMAAKGLTRGCNPTDGNTKFCPDALVTRGQMAAFLDRYFRPGATNVDSFVDDDGHLFEAELNRTAQTGIFRGCNPPVGDEVCPDATITRGQLAAVIYRAYGLDATGGNTFADVKGHHFETEISALAAAGITKGCDPAEGNTRYCPDEPVTRGQVAAMLRRADAIYNARD